MKNKKFLFLSLLILAIGFAAVSTTLYISGNLVFGTNKNDFDIYFSGAIVDDEDKSNEVILSDKKHIEYETKELKKLGDRSVLEFEVTNNSTQYDAKVSISCTLSDNEYLTYTTDSNEYNIPAQTRESGKVIVELIKASTSILNPTISCELVSTAEERNASAETVITDSSYEITGTLTDEEGNILANKNLVVYSETPHYVTTDDYGFFYVNGLEKGSHEIYYVNTEDATGKTKEEVKELAETEAKITTSSTKINFENIKLNDFKINVEKEEEINITLDADTGSIDSNTLKLNKYEKGSKLPEPVKEYYEFLGWYDGEKLITPNTIIDNNVNLKAKWIEKEYNVIYVVNGVEYVEKRKKSENFLEPKTIDINSNNYYFKGWSLSDNGEINDNIKLENNLKLYGNLYEKKYYLYNKGQWNKLNGFHVSNIKNIGWPNHLAPTYSANSNNLIMQTTAQGTNLYQNGYVFGNNKIYIGKQHSKIIIYFYNLSSVRNDGRTSGLVSAMLFTEEDSSCSVPNVGITMVDRATPASSTNLLSAVIDVSDLEGEYYLSFWLLNTYYVGNTFKIQISQIEIQ